MRLIDANKIRDYVKEQINPYGKPFDGSAYEFGLKLIKYLENMSTDYDVDKVVEEFEKESYRIDDSATLSSRDVIDIDDAIEIVNQGSVSDDVCEWKVLDVDSNLYVTECKQHRDMFDGTPEENEYVYCPYCGKKIKVVK